MIDRDMKKKELERTAGISNYVIYKMTGNENITVKKVVKDLQITKVYAE